MGLGNWAKNEWHEAKDAGKEIWHFVRTHNWKTSAKNSFKRKYWVWWIVGIILCVAVGLISYYRDTIVEKFEPHKDDIVNLPASWVIPIAVLVILSFPPLGGHEIVLLVVGLIWGVWVGFAIACAGTLIGEILCFYLFKYLLTSKAASIEQESVFYACIARLMRSGGLWIIIVVRFSAIPGHVVTAIQSTVGMSVWIYAIAVIISLPKQLAVVWLGEMFGETEGVSDPATVKKQQRISLSVFFATCLATVLSLYIVYMRARKLYPEVLRDMEAHRISKDSLASGSAENVNDVEIVVDSTGRPIRRDSFVEAAFEGEQGISYVAPQNKSPRAHGMVRTETGGTWRSDLSEGEFRAGSGGTGAGAWQDGGYSVEDRERRQHEEAEEQRRRGLGYGQLAAGESRSSFSHLPLASESEVGVTPRAPSGGPLSLPPSYPSSSSSSRQPYNDPFSNPSQTSLHSSPYGTAPYAATAAASTTNASSSVHIPLQPPPSGPSSHAVRSPASSPRLNQQGSPSIPYLSPPPASQGQSLGVGMRGAGAGGMGSRPTSVGGTEIMTGVGAGGGGYGGGGGTSGATGQGAYR
ncbi:hypothetical protein JCM11641_004114 [Rhodosporidiobolus odoratus]